MRDEASAKAATVRWCVVTTVLTSDVSEVAQDSFG